jgi:hypothetical protein
MSTRATRPPWKKANPNKKAGGSRRLTPAQKASAKASARKAGRPYPNLVDNMNAAKKKTSRKTKASSAAKKSGSRKRPASRSAR